MCRQAPYPVLLCWGKGGNERQRWKSLDRCGRAWTGMEGMHAGVRSRIVSCVSWCHGQCKTCLLASFLLAVFLIGYSWLFPSFPRSRVCLRMTCLAYANVVLPGLPGHAHSLIQSYFLSIYCEPGVGWCCRAGMSKMRFVPGKATCTLDMGMHLFC